MNILGISCYYHDAAAALVKEGKLVAAAEEERFTRKKHDSSFPVNAAKYCLEEAGIDAKQLNYAAFYDKPILKFERLMSQHLQEFPKSWRMFLHSTPAWINEKLRVKAMLKKKLKYKGPIVYSEHHLSHAASAFLVSPFKEAAILTLDGVGEWATTEMSAGKGNKIEVLKQIDFPHSLGLLYSTVTAHLGFSVNNSEYKVMGLAALGKPKYFDDFLQIIDVKDDGSYRLDMSYFDFHHAMHMPGKKFLNKFGDVRKENGEVNQHHKDLAASVQRVLEYALFKMLNYLHDETKMDKLCMAGGVALNSVANGKILRNTKFKHIYIQAAASDAGSSLGAAFLAYNTVLGKPRGFVMEHAYWGPKFNAEQIKKYLDENGVKYTEFKDANELLAKTAKIIFDSKIVGWLQGRMEWGPRALGARSILSNPCDPKIKDILNLKVKHREPFRPFAPVVPVEDANEYFECDLPVPLAADFMLMVYPVREEKKKLIPAVVHVDGSGRLQTIRRAQNPLYYELIREFEKLSGVPILINTSFNVRGEPIVCTPEHAYRCMMGTGIDALVMGRFLIKREDNPQHMWDSEKYAKD